MKIRAPSPVETQSVSTSKERKLSGWSISERAVSVSKVNKVSIPEAFRFSPFSFYPHRNPSFSAGFIGVTFAP